MLELKRLRLLWELHTRGTVAAVAEALNYCPSAVSQQLAVLEREAGTVLLRKSGRTLELTAAGRVLVHATAELLAGLETAEAALHRAGSEITGIIRIAAFQSALLTLLPGALRRVREAHPELRIEIVQFEPAAALKETWSRAFDLVVAEEYPGHSNPHFDGLDRVSLTCDPIRIGVPPQPDREISAQNWISATKLTELADAPWVMEPRGAATRHWSEQMCRLAGFEPDVRYETPDIQAQLRLIETGNAVGMLPGLVHAPNASRVRLLSLPSHPHRTVFTAARKSLCGHPGLTAVRSALATEAAEVNYHDEGELPRSQEN